MGVLLAGTPTTPEGRETAGTEEASADRRAPLSTIAMVFAVAT